MIDCFKCKKIGLFLGGVLFGTAGVKILGSDDAKRFYINCLAAGLRAKDCVMTTATNIQENAEDILAEAREINAQRCREDVFEDESGEEAPEQTSEDLKEDETACMRAAAGKSWREYRGFLMIMSGFGSWCRRTAAEP